MSGAWPARVAPSVRGWFEGRAEEMADLLHRLVEVESPSDRPSTQAAVFDLLAPGLRAAGLGVRRLAGRTSGGQLLARADGRDGPLQLLLGHCDTVWPLGTLSARPPARDGDLFRGPGAFDMKAGLVQIVFALRALRELGLTAPGRPVVFVTSDEEIGSRDSANRIRLLARRSARVLILEPSHGERGCLKTARKGLGQFTLLIRGRSAHAGLDPETGASAILELGRQLPGIFALADPEAGTSVNVGIVRGGTRGNVVAAEARAVIDARAWTPSETRRLSEALHGLRPLTPGTTLTITGGFDRPPMEPTPRNRALWEAAREAGTALGMALCEAAVGGGSDGNLTSPLAATLDGLGAVGGGAHAEDEHVRLSALLERTALLTLLLLAPLHQDA